MEDLPHRKASGGEADEMRLERKGNTGGGIDKEGEDLEKSCEGGGSGFEWWYPSSMHGISRNISPCLPACVCLWEGLSPLPGACLSGQ